MPVTLTSLAALADLPYDEVIDVRSPSEFAEDHIPGAINLPVLSDTERAEVGTVYVQQDRFLARKIGAARVARNAAAHIEGPLADRGGGWRPLVYCWRGGQRSGSFASILEQIGWRVGLVQGGYKSYRALVKTALYDTPLAQQVVLVSGVTGTGKTDVLAHLGDQGAQVIDLEGLANHRGSLFGGMSTQQPSQKLFESRLAMALCRLDPAEPLFLEAESNKIGNILIPPQLWAVMQAAPRIELEARLPDRAAYLARAYADLLADPVQLAARIAKLAAFHSKAQIARWQQMAQERAFEALAAELVELHYDPRYAKSAAQQPAPTGRIALGDLSDADLARAAMLIRETAAR